MTRPKTCPFHPACHSEVMLLELKPSEYDWAVVAECGARGPACDTKDAAVVAWNTRPREGVWLNVIDQLPEQGDQVLTWDGHVRRLGWFVVVDGEGKFIDPREEEELKEVTHWAVVPEPPAVKGKMQTEEK